MMVNATLSINGRRHPVNADAEMPLLWVLRDRLGLTGTKYGCGVGICGACTIHIDGVAVRSCQVTLADATGEIVTIEGLAGDGQHPLQLAWIELQVAQCGYCQPGMIMAAAALLAEDASPDKAAIDAAMTNICRCATYPRIRAAIERVAGK